MSDRHEDKQPIDPVIRAALRARQVTASDACLDAETLAAWFEGGLDATLTAAVDAHLTDCMRCQAMLAALSESGDEAAAAGAPRAVVVPFAKPSRMRWIAPLAAGVAAAGLLFWMILPSRESVPSSAVTTLAEQSAPQATPPASAAIPSPSARQEPAAPARAQNAATDTQKTAEAVMKPGPAPAPRPLPIPSTGAALPATTQQDPKVTLTAPPPVATAKPSPVATPPPPPAVIAQPPARTAATADQALARADRNVMKFETNRKYPIEFAPPVPQGGGRGGGGGGAAGGGGGGRVAGGAVSTLRTPAPTPAQIRWRILENGRLERTVNSGTTWTAVPLEGPVFITAGAAASPTIVWIVGREGVVFRSVDGATFARIDFPNTLDLEAVTALSVDRATVSTRDGRVFSTTDGGHTWRSN